MNNQHHSFINFSTILTIIFVIAKIGGYITWSWWLVFSPIFISFGIALFIFLIGIIVMTRSSRF